MNEAQTCVREAPGHGSGESGALPGAPEDHREASAKRQQILDGARRAFLADGFDGASMSAIARAAGVSKGTLYVYFQSKEALFEALIREDRRRQGERLCALGTPGSDLAADLAHLAHDLVAILTGPESLAQVRAVIGVTAKFPRVGLAFYEAGPLHGRARLAEYLARQGAAGALMIDDAEIAAGQFLDLAISEPVRAALFGANDRYEGAALAAHVDRAVGLFMRAYGPREGNVRTGSTSPRS